MNASPTFHTTIQRDEPQPSPHEQASLASSTAVMIVHTPESVHYNQWRARTAAAGGGAARKRPPVNPPPAYLWLCAAAATILTTLAIFLNLNPSFFDNTPSSSDDAQRSRRYRRRPSSSRRWRACLSATRRQPRPRQQPIRL